MKKWKAEANQNSQKEADKRNVSPTITASSDWLPLSAFPLFRRGVNVPLEYY